MHGLSASQGILDVVLHHGLLAVARRIVAVSLVIGNLTGFVDESIQFYSDSLSKDTLAEGARLSFERIPARVRCRQCGAEYGSPDSRLWTCPRCAALGGEVVAGREFFVASIEIE